MKINTGKSVFAGLMLAILISAAVLPATAHHSFSAFNTQVEKSVTGTVKQVDWTNPHIWIWVNVPNAQGNLDVFGFEGMSPNYLERRNWTRTSLKAGDKITIAYRPLKDGKNGGMFMTGTLPSGKVLTMSGSSADK